MGFIVKIQKNLSSMQRKLAVKAVDNFVKRVTEHNGSYAKAYNTRAGHASYFKRNALGYMFDGLFEGGLTLRRISKNKRVFGVVKLEDIYIPSLKITADEYGGCKCPFGGAKFRTTKGVGYQEPHGGALRVKMNLNNHDDFVTVYIDD